MFEHATFSYDISNTFGAYDCRREGMLTCEYSSIMYHDGNSGQGWLSLPRVDVPSSLRIYFSAKDKFVSFLSTIRTLPKAPRPTTRNNRKWLRFTKKR